MFKPISTISLLVTLLAACGQKEKEYNLKIEGVYVCQTNNEFNITWDTIHISVISKKAGTYFINHKAGFQRIRNGKLRDKEYKETGLIGNWEENSRQLKTEKLGRVYSFPESGKLLLMGTIPYIKLN